MTTATRPAPSPEVRAMLAEFARINRERYGENWKEIVAKQVAESTAPVLSALLKLRKKPE
jgi:hypothetical protein